MKTTFIRLVWDELSGEGEIKKVNDFDERDFITKLDFLKDCIFELQNLYDDLLTKEKF